MKINSLMSILVVGFGILLLPTTSARRINRRTEFTQVPPISGYGFVVPLQGGDTCANQTNCTTTLPGPSPDKTLRYLALARGITYWTCKDRKPTQSPQFLSQETDLWDVAPLMPQIPSEELFHTLVPQLLEFDYASLKNSSLVCLGEMTTVHVETYFEVFDAVLFPAHIQKLITAPDNLKDKNIQWAYYASLDLTWNVYRVKTAGGLPPPTCQELNSTLQVEYASEYWFYHA